MTPDEIAAVIRTELDSYACAADRAEAQRLREQAAWCLDRAERLEHEADSRDPDKLPAPVDF